MITTETGVAGHWAGPVGLPQFTQANSRLVDGPSHRVEKGRHPSRLQPVLRHVIDGNAPVDDLVFRVELNQREESHGIPPKSPWTRPLVHRTVHGS